MNAHVKEKFGGYYPCTVELYRKLKRLNYLCLLSRRRDAEGDRWCRKEPQNRVYKHRYSADGSRGAWFVVAPKPEPIYSSLHSSIYDAVYTDYRSARFPVDTPEKVKTIKLTEDQIDKWLIEMEEWMAKDGPPCLVLNDVMRSLIVLRRMEMEHQCESDDANEIRGMFKVLWRLMSHVDKERARAFSVYLCVQLPLVNVDQSQPL